MRNLKQLFLLASFAALTCLFFSCEQCKSCSASVKQEIFMDTLIGSQTIDQTAVEVCGEELEEIEANPEVVVTTSQEILGITQETVTTTTYTCE